MNSGLTIETKNLTIRYGHFTAVSQLNLHINAGESYGFLGPNGAGKTTTLLTILGLMHPTEGEVRINGKHITSQSFELKSRIGYVPEHQTFYEEMSGLEYLLFFGKLYQIEDAHQRSKKILEHLGLWKWRDVVISGYSNGMKRKLGFARATIHAPDLLVLDEPIAGLDPMGIIQIRELLLEEQARGCTLLISSHILSEVEKTANRVGILSKGKLVWQDTMENLQHWVTSEQRIVLTLQSIDDEIISDFKSLPFIKDVIRQGNSLSLIMDKKGDFRKEISQFVYKNNLVLLEMKEEKTSLEEAFVNITENKLNNLPKSLKE